MLANMDGINVQRMSWQRLLPVVALILLGSLWYTWAALSSQPLIFIARPPALAPAPRLQPANFPLWFEQNIGQAGPEVAFVAHGQGRTISFTHSGILIATRNEGQGLSGAIGPSAQMTPEMAPSGSLPAVLGAQQAAP